MRRFRSLALVAGLAVSGGMVAEAEAQRAAPGEPLTGEALRRRITDRALVSRDVTINLYANGRITVWAGGRLTTDGRWRMCGPTRICAQAERAGQIDVTLYPNGTGTMGGSNGGAFTVRAIDRSRDGRARS